MFNLRRTVIFLIAAVISLNCTKQSDKKESSIVNCSESKTEMLINEILKKRYFIDLANSFYDKDSSFRYNYFYVENIVPAKNVYYIRMNYDFKNVKVDSLKLKVTADRNAFYMDANMLSVKLKSANLDTTEVMMNISYGLYNNVAMNWSDYTFVFDPANCKWNVKDSVFNEY
jgi:hypothetical protein